MLQPNTSQIVDTVTRFLVPFIQIFSLYVIFHGHYSPGGGFQGGALFAASVILERLVLGEKSSWRLFSQNAALILAIAGLLAFSGIGLLAMHGGGFMLDYAALPLREMDAATLRSFGILAVEIGIACCVLGTLVLIFDQLISGSQN